MTVQETGLVRTLPPTIASDPLANCPSSITITYCLKIAPSTESATPSGLSNLVCTVYQNGTPMALQPGCESAPLQYGATGVSSGDIFTATVTQADGIVSLSGTWSAPR